MIVPLILAATVTLDSWQPQALGYRETRAQSAVETADLTLQDTKRNRTLPLRIYYPTLRLYYPIGLSAGLPVIIFSHGAGSSKDGNERLLSYWASFGYVVMAPSHPDGIAGYQPGESFSAYMQRTLGAVGQNPDEWKERPLDISFIIDSFPEIERGVPALQGRLDATRIGVSGHSYGADTTMLIAGATMTLPGASAPQSFADPRVRSAIMFSPQGIGIFGLRSDSWNAMRIPSMIVTGSNDRVQTGADASTRREPFNGEPPGDKYFVSIEGANHFSVTGARFLGPSEDPILREMDVASLAFWDAYLQRDPTALAYLQSGALPNMGQPAVTLDRK